MLQILISYPFDQSANHHRSRTLHTNAHLWPSINQKGLRQAHHLLLLLHSRGRVLPWTFILADIKTAHLAFTPGSYGKVATVRARETSMVGSGLIFRRDGRTNAAPCLTARMGLLGLEIQASMYKFLLRCVTLILHDTECPKSVLAPH